ncbi:hypothetical protein BD311DRAFT_655967 [Dichomitus squalens]|uniref:Uncharacterized protein n=1 Tax=Dichomitus squalens TaxID=114155 RepID=A0A4Q9MV60_9APHY|nr:hypothetical protein BD311DRAFT_655967 [Dichomitus squalens]
MSATVQTSPISFVPFSFSATGTGTTETSVVRTTAAVASSSPGPSSADAWALEDLMGDITDLKVASAALLIGLVIASLTFGMVCTKAMSYFRGEKKGGALVLMTVSSMVFINLIQFIATVAAAYTSFVIDFGSWDDLLSTKW